MHKNLTMTIMNSSEIKYMEIKMKTQNIAGIATIIMTLSITSTYADAVADANQQNFTQLQSMILKVQKDSIDQMNELQKQISTNTTSQVNQLQNNIIQI